MSGIIASELSNNQVHIINFRKMSDEENFFSSSTEEIAENPLFGIISDSGMVISNFTPEIDLKDKHVVIWVHGYNTGNEEIAGKLLMYQSLIFPITQKFLLVGIIWPGCNKTLNYYVAKANARKIAPIFSTFLFNTIEVVASTNIIAHSMGNFLTLKTLSSENSSDVEKGLTLTPIIPTSDVDTRKKITNLFLLAAAVDDEVLDKGEVFHRVPHLTERTIICYNDSDLALWGYGLFEFDSALGSSSCEDGTDGHKNLYSVDCEPGVKGYRIKGHSYDTMPIGMFIKSVINGLIKFDEGSTYELSPYSGNIKPCDTPIKKSNCCVLL